MSFGNSSFATSIRTPPVAAPDAAIQREQFTAQPDRYGVFYWWPDEDASWIHPYDHSLASDFIPSDRVWQRYRGEAEFDLFCHGEIAFRAQARMWLNVEMEGYWIGDWVEVLSQHGRRRPFMAQISEVRWNRLQRRFEYSLRLNGRPLTSRYAAEMFRRCRSLTWWQHEDWRAAPLREATEIRIEPLEDAARD